MVAEKTAKIDTISAGVSAEAGFTVTGTALEVGEVTEVEEAIYMKLSG